MATVYKFNKYMLNKVSEVSIKKISTTVTLFVNCICIVYLGLHLCLYGLQLLFDLLDLPHDGCLGLLQSRELPFSLLSLLLYALKLLAGGLILLLPEEKIQRDSVLIANRVFPSCTQYSV